MLILILILLFNIYNSIKMAKFFLLIGLNVRRGKLNFLFLMIRDGSDSIGSLRSLEPSRVERAEPIGVGSGAKPN